MHNLKSSRHGMVMGPEGIAGAYTVSLSPIVYGTAYRVAKRALDIMVSAIGLFVLFPFLLMASILIKVTSRGPILYAWNVVGRAGLPFRGYKFRTMTANADELKPQLLAYNEMRGPVFKMESDPRITPVGKLLRKYSLDELPQLWSVLKGDMSLVGPRPAGSTEWPDYEPWQRRKLSVTPGITCLWQVSGRNEINDFEEWVRMDLQYIDNWSLKLDLKTLFKTIFIVLAGTGK